MATKEEIDEIKLFLEKQFKSNELQILDSDSV
jgi:hypothetical protein